MACAACNENGPGRDPWDGDNLFAGENTDEKEFFIGKETEDDEERKQRMFEMLSSVRLIDNALEDIGYGRYQIQLALLTALCIFVDVSEIALTSLLFVEFQKEWHVKLDELAVIGAMSAAGLMTGSLLCGWFSDKYGRKKIFGPTLLLLVIFSVISSFATGIPSFATCRFFVGISAGGNMVGSNSLLLETVPSSIRAKIVLATGVAFGTTHLVVVSLAWVLFPLIGWRAVVLILAGFSVPMLFLLTRMVESPRFLVENGKFVEAMETISKIAQVNGKTLPSYVTAEKLERQHKPRMEASSGLFSAKFFHLFTRRNLSVLMPLSLVWLLQAFAGGIFQFLPLEFKHLMKGTSIQYVTAVVMAVAALVGTFVNFTVVGKFSRTFCIRISTFFSALSTFSLVLGHGSVLLFVSAFFMHVFSCITTQILFLYTPEIFPTRIRATAFGFCLVFYRIAHIISPFLVAALLSSSMFLISVVFGCIYCLAAGSSWLLKPAPENDCLYEDEDDLLSDEKAEPRNGGTFTEDLAESRPQQGKTSFEI